MEIKPYLVIWSGSVKINLHSMLQPFESFFLHDLKLIYHCGFSLTEKQGGREGEKEECKRSQNWKSNNKLL